MILAVSGGENGGHGGAGRGEGEVVAEERDWREGN